MEENKKSRLISRIDGNQSKSGLTLDPATYRKLCVLCLFLLVFASLDKVYYQRPQVIRLVVVAQLIKFVLD